MWSIQDSSGNSINLYDNGVYVKATTGTGLPDPENLTTRYGLIDGAAWQRRIFAPRQFTLICDLAPGTGLKGLHQLRQHLISFMSINANAPIKVVYQHENSIAYIDCYYANGLGMGEKQGFTEKISLTFLATNPLWYESELLSQVVSSASAETVNYIMQNDDLMAGGLDNKVYSILKEGTDYYAFGLFTGYGRKWNGAAWSDIGDKPRGGVLQAIKSGADIYAVGNAKVVEKLVGSEWDCLAVSQPNGTIYAIVVDGSNNVYIGGNFTSVSGVTVSNIAMWNGKTWSTVGGGVNGIVYGLWAEGTDIYLAGAFTDAGGVTGADYIAKWNGSIYSIIGSASDLDATAYSIVVDVSGNIYCGGDFTTPTAKVAIYSATALAWGTVTSCDAQVTQLTNNDTLGVFAVSPTGTFSVYSVYVFTWDSLNEEETWDDIGTWETAPDIINTSERVAKLTGTFDSSVPNNLITPYSCYATSTTLYVGHSTGLTQWVSPTYTSLVTTTNPVYAVTANGSDIYFGGSFTHVDGNYALRYNGGSTYALGAISDLNNTVRALYNQSGRILVGGAFTAVSGLSMNYLAGYESSRWYSLVYSSAIKAILIEGLYAYIGGAFGVIRITLSNGLSTELGALTNVNTLTYLTNLYAGGSFTENVKKWNGAAWVSVDSGTNGEVYQLANDGSTVYMVGDFEQAGSEVACGGIARLIGGIWVNFGTGINTTSYFIRCIQVVSATEIYVGGDFPQFNGTTITFPVMKFNGTSWVEYLDNYESADADVLSLLIEDVDGVSTVGFNAVANVTFFGDIISYEGTAPAAPQLILSGTGTVTSFRNTTHEADIYFNSLTLVAGDVATLDLTPNAISFTKLNYGITSTNLLGKITAASTPSKLRLYPGDNSIRVVASGTITATVKWQNKHWSVDGVV